MRRNLAIATITMMIAASPIFAVGTVNQTISPIGRDPGSNPDNRIHQLAINWTADASVGTVPVTTLNVGSFPAIQGMRLVSVEIKPGSPAPTNNYTITITDAAGVDLLGGTGANLSNTTATSTTITNLPAPVFGGLTFTLTGNSVNSAAGSVFAYFAPVSQTTITTGAPTFTGANTFTGSNIFRGATTVSTLNNTCYIDGVTWTSIQSAITSGTCGEINDRGVFSTALGTLNITRQVKILLGNATYTTTGIAMSSPAIIEGLSNATFLSYTPTSGNALALTGTQPNVPGDYSLRDLRFFGTGAGSTSTGIFFNLTASNNTQAIFERIVVDSFGTGITSAAGVNGTGFTTFLHSSIFGNGQNINFPAGVSGERFELLDTNVNNTFAGTNWANCFSVASSAMNIRLIGGAIDYCQLSVSAGFVEMGSGTYVEDTTAVIGTCTSTTSTGCAVAVSGTGVVQLDGMLAFISGATNQAFAGVTGNGILAVIGGTYNSNGSGSVGPLVCGASSGNLVMQPLPNLINGYVGAQLWAGGCASLNQSQASSFGLPTSAIFGGTTADVCNGWQNAHAGGVNWLECNAGTGAFAGTAGDLYFYNGTNNFLEFGGGVNGLKMRGANFLPSVVNSTDVGSTALPFKNLWLGTAATNNFSVQPAATSAARVISIPDPGVNTNLALNLTATSAAFATATTAGTCVQSTTAVAGAATTMAVLASPVSTPGVGAVWSAFVSSAGNVTINECAVATSAGGTIAFNIRVTP